MAASRTIQLRARRTETPRCASFDDLEAVVTYERAVRVARAHAEPYSITALDGRSDGRFAVERGGSQHVVDLVDGSGQRDSCSCPDYATNRLGTCKHLEAVRRVIAASPRLAASLRRIGDAPEHPTLYARGELGLAVMFHPGSAARRKGMPKADVALDEAAVVALERRLGSGLRVTEAARRARAELAARDARTARTETLRRGPALGVDVLRTPLFPYQRDGVRHLVTAGRALLADDMGLGKTVQALAAAEVLRARGEVRRVVIVTNASLKGQWAAEVARHTTARAAVLEGPVARRQQIIHSDAPYLVLNYELAMRDRELLAELELDLLVLDEAQRAKNFRSKTAEALRALRSRFLFVLTGTPVENRLDDLYALVQLLDPEVLGPLYRFNAEFTTQDERGKIRGYRNLGALRERIAPVLLRRMKETVLSELPSLTAQTRHLDLTPMQASLEAHHRQQATMILARAAKRPLTPKEQKAATANLTLARLASDAAVLVDPQATKDRVPKLDELEAILEEVASQGSTKVIVFSEWTSMLELAAARARRLGLRFEMLHGQVASAKRPALIERFLTDPGCRVLFSSDAGGAGLNLQAASYVVHLDLPWNPARLDQRNGRAHRLGQSRGVTVIHLCAEDGIERGIEGTLARKRALRGGALDAHSELETLELQSFIQVVREITEALDDDDVHATEVDDVMVVEPVESAEPSDPSASADPIASIAAPVAAAAAETAARAPRTVRATTVHKRLRFAQVAWDAGFPAEALRTAYEAAADALRHRLDDSPQEHLALVARARRELVPSGAASLPLLASFAGLRDLCALGEEPDLVDDDVVAEALAAARTIVTALVPDAPA